MPPSSRKHAVGQVSQLEFSPLNGRSRVVIENVTPYAWTSASYLRAYWDGAKAAGFLPTDISEFRTLLEAYLLEKSLYDLRYELNNRPEWAAIPLEGILQLIR